MHVGKTAYSGHYMAQIKNFDSKEWYQFNDEQITRIKKKQQLGCTDDEPQKSEQQDSSQSSTKSSSSSTSNAYLLVYYRKDLFEDAAGNELRQRLNVVSLSDAIDKQKEEVERDNEAIETWHANLVSLKQDQKENRASERALMSSIYESLWCNHSNEAFFIPTEFLKKWLSDPSDKTVLNSSQKYLCRHKKLNPLAVNRFKLVSKKGLEALMGFYGAKETEIGALEASNEETTRCLTCVSNIMAFIRLKERIKEDAKTLRNLLKSDVDEDLIILDEIATNSMQEETVQMKSRRYFWLGKESLRLWTNMAVKKLEAQLPTCKFNDCAESVVMGEVPVVQNDEGNNKENVMKSDEAAEDSVELGANSNASSSADLQARPITFSFNEEIICPHGNLMPTLNRRLVSVDVVTLFGAYFPTAKYFASDAVECYQCCVSKKLIKI